MSQDYVEELIIKIAKYLAKKLKRNKSSNSTATVNNEDVPHIENTSEVKNNETVETNTSDINPNTQQTEQVGDVSSETEDKGEVPDDGTNTQEEIPAHSSIFFHFTIFLIWCIVACLNVPVVLTWARNFK